MPLQGLPSTAKALKMIRGLYKQARSGHERIASDVGQWLLENDALLTTTYGFEGICELLEVNQAHRAEVVQYAGDMSRAIFAVAFESGLEESASRQSGRNPADWKDGPLYQAFWEMRVHVCAEARQIEDSRLGGRTGQWPNCGH